MSSETRLLSKLLINKRYKDIVEFNIKPIMFNTHKSEFDYILNYCKQYKEMPSEEVYLRMYPKFEIEKVEEPLEYCVNELKYQNKLIQFTSLTNYLNTTIGQPLIETREISDKMELAETKIKQTLSNLALFGKSRDTSYRESVEERIEDYIISKENDGMTGILTRWTTLNSAMGGFQDDHLIAIVARPYTGKTWFACILASDFLNGGRKILFITKQQPRREIMRRIDSIQTSTIHRDIVKGALTSDKEELYFNRLRDLQKGNGDIIVVEDDFGVDRSFGVSSVDGKIEEHDPDVVIIDSGMDLADDFGAREERLRFKNIVKGLKGIATRRKIPVVMIWQVRKNTKGGLDNYFGSDAVTQDADDIIELRFPGQETKSDKRQIILTKIKEGNETDFFINYDGINVNYDECPEYEPETYDCEEDSDNLG